MTHRTETETETDLTPHRSRNVQYSYTSDLIDHRVYRDMFSNNSPNTRPFCTGCCYLVTFLFVEVGWTSGLSRLDFAIVMLYYIHLIYSRFFRGNGPRCGTASPLQDPFLINLYCMSDAFPSAHTARARSLSKALAFGAHVPATVESIWVFCGINQNQS